MQTYRLKTYFYFHSLQLYNLLGGPVQKLTAFTTVPTGMPILGGGKNHINAMWSTKQDPVAYKHLIEASEHCFSHLHLNMFFDSGGNPCKHHTKSTTLTRNQTQDLCAAKSSQLETLKSWRQHFQPIHRADVTLISWQVTAVA